MSPQKHEAITGNTKFSANGMGGHVVGCMIPETRLAWKSNQSKIVERGAIKWQTHDVVMGRPIFVFFFDQILRSG